MKSNPYLHPGGNKLIRTKDILGIFDLDSITRSEISRDLLRRAEQRGSADSAVYELPKSVIISRKGDVLYSQISSRVLAARAEE